MLVNRITHKLKHGRHAILQCSHRIASYCVNQTLAGLFSTSRSHTKNYTSRGFSSFPITPLPGFLLNNTVSSSNRTQIFSFSQRITAFSRQYASTAEQESATVRSSKAKLLKSKATAAKTTDHAEPESDVDEEESEDLAALMNEQIQGLNESQRIAVEADFDIPVQIIAPPGSGKTEVLCRRAIYIAQKNPNATVLVNTFTNKATAEFIDRVKVLSKDRPVKNIVCKTIHAFGLEVLRKHNATDNKLKVISLHQKKQVIREELRKFWENNFTKSENGEAIDPDKRVYPMVMFIREHKVKRGKTEKLNPEQKHVFEAYENYLRTNYLVDFEDMVIRCEEILRENKELARELEETYKFILIDEFQDTCLEQYKIFKYIREKNKSISVVGDPNQSIYAFRGVDPHIFFRFEEDFKPMTIYLSVNYRSDPSIIEKSQHFIKHCGLRHVDVQHDPNRGPSSGDVYITSHDTPYDEARVIATKIREIQRLHPNDSIAILSRARKPLLNNNEGQSVLMQTLSQYGVESNYSLFDDSPLSSIFEKAEMKKIRGILELVFTDNAETNGTAFSYILSLIPFFGKSNTKARMLFAFQNQRRKSDGTIEKLPPPELNLKNVREFVKKLERAKATLEKDPSLRPFIDAFNTLDNNIQQLRAKFNVDDGAATTGETPATVRSTTDNVRKCLDEVFGVMNINKDSRYAREFRKHFRAFHKGYKGTDTTIAEKVRDFLLYVENIPEQGIKDVESAKQIFVGTIHAAKGKQWDHVFVIANSSMYRTTKVDPEEARIFYVAMTRAKKNVYASYSGPVPKIHIDILDRMGTKRIHVEVEEPPQHLKKASKFEIISSVTSQARAKKRQQQQQEGSSLPQQQLQQQLQ